MLALSWFARSRLVAVPYLKSVLKESLTVPGSMPLRTGPKNCQWPLVKRIIRICSTVAWSHGLVLIWMPGTIIGICKPLIERACFMMFSRDRSSPQFFRTSRMSLAFR